MGAGSSHLPGPGPVPSDVLGGGSASVFAPGIQLRSDTPHPRPGKVTLSISPATMPRSVSGLHTLDADHIATVRSSLGELGMDKENSTLLLVAPAHRGNTRVVLVLLLSGRIEVIAGGERGGTCGACGSRVRVERSNKFYHVDHLTAVTASADAAEPNCCSVKLEFGSAPPIVLTLAEDATGDLLSHIRSLRALSRGIPATMNDGLVFNTAPTLTSLPWRPPEAHSPEAGILLGVEIALSARAPSLAAVPEIVTAVGTAIKTFAALGSIDFGKLGQNLMLMEALLPALSQNVARGTPSLNAVKFADSSTGAEQFALCMGMLSTAWSIQKMSLKNMGISVPSWTAFVQSSIATGGCSQCSDLSLAGNPALANAMLGQTFSTWPRMPVMDLASAVPIYSTSGSLQKLTLDSCGLSHAQAAEILAGLMHHVPSLIGLSMAGAIAGGSPSDSVAVLAALGSLLAKSLSLCVLDVSDCSLALDKFPRVSKAPLQVLNLGGNHLTSSAGNVNALVKSAAKSLQLVSLRGTKVAGPLSPVLCDGMADLDFVADFSGIQAPAGLAATVQTGNGAPRAIILRDASAEQAVEAVSLIQLPGSTCSDLDLRLSSPVVSLGAGGDRIVPVLCPPGVGPGALLLVESCHIMVPAGIAPGQQFQAILPATQTSSGPAPPVANLLLSSSLTCLNISKCGLGSSLTAAIAGLATQPTLTSLDISHNNAMGAIAALCLNLKGNRSMTSLQLAGNSPSVDEIAALGKFFGGVNIQTGVLWGNKTIVMMDVPSKGFDADLEKHMAFYQQIVAKGTEDMAVGSRVIKSAYQHPNHYRRPNLQTKQRGIVQKVGGKKAIASANKAMDKLKKHVSVISTAIKRNQNIMSIKEQSKLGPGMTRAAAKQSAVVERQRAKYTQMVTTKRAKRLREWDAVMRSIGAAYYTGWRHQYGAAFDLNGWKKLKALIPADHLSNTKVAKLLAKTEAEMMNQAQVRKRHFLSHLYIKCIILPRQARDKHRKNSKKVPFSRSISANSSSRRCSSSNCKSWLLRLRRPRM
jgi:hypothetical protein